MSSTTSRMAMYKPASGENVNVVTDLNNNLDSLDLNMNFRTCTSSTRPSVKWDGMTIHETDTRKSYVWNATPAVSGWYEIFTAETPLTQVNLAQSATGSFTLTSKINTDTTSRLQVRGDGRLEWGPGGAAATDTFLSRSGSNALSTAGDFTVTGNTTISSTTESTALNVSGGGTISKSLTIGGSASLGSGQGVLTLRNATTPPTANPTDGAINWVSSDRLFFRSSKGMQLVGVGAQSVVADSTKTNPSTETLMYTFTIPANDSTTGSTYRIRAWGTFNSNGAATATFKGYIGGTGGTLLVNNGGIASTGTVSNRIWNAEIFVVNTSGGASGKCNMHGIWFTNISTNGLGTATPDSRMSGFTEASNINWTANQDIALTIQITPSNASNNLRIMGAIAERCN